MSRRDLLSGPGVALPPNKDHHYFLSHKKEHSLSGRVPEQVAKNFHDGLEMLGYKGFFDVDDLTKIDKAEIKAAVGRSCALIVVLHNETWDSEWCRYEWEAAAEFGIPVRVIVDCERCSKVKALEAVKPWPKLLEFQFLLFIESNRRECLDLLCEWLDAHVLKDGGGAGTDGGRSPKRLSRPESCVEGPRGAAPPAVPDSYLCPVTSELMLDPVATADGFTYERDAIEEWFGGGNSTSPLTGAILSNTVLIPNHSLRSAIQEFVEANPSARTLMHEAAPKPSDQLPAQMAAAALAADPFPAVAAPHGAAAPEGAPVVVVAAPLVTASPLAAGAAPSVLAAPLATLSAEEAAAAAAHAVPDWGALQARRAGKKASGGGGGGGGGFFGGRKKGTTAEAEPAEHGLDPAVLTVRGAVAGMGGAAVTASVGGPAGLAQLAAMLAAAGSAPVGVLEVATQERIEPGTDTLHASPGFGLFTRALAGGGCLRGLRDLAISRLALPAPAAAALAQALHGHPRLQSLELWNVELDDEGGMAVARLAASASCPALAKLNLGRHLMGPLTTKTIESMLDGSAVRLSM